MHHLVVQTDLAGRLLPVELYAQREALLAAQHLQVARARNRLGLQPGQPRLLLSPLLHLLLLLQLERHLLLLWATRRLAKGEPEPEQGLDRGRTRRRIGSPLGLSGGITQLTKHSNLDVLGGLQKDVLVVIGFDIRAGRLSRRSQLSAHERQVGLAQEAAAVSALRV